MVCTPVGECTASCSLPWGGGGCGISNECTVVGNACNGTSVGCMPEMCGHVIRCSQYCTSVDQRCVAMSSGDAHSVAHRWTVDQTCVAMSSGDAHSVVYQWTVDQRCVAMSSGDAHSVVYQWTVDQRCVAMSSGDAHSVVHQWTVDQRCVAMSSGDAHSVVHHWTKDVWQCLQEMLTVLYISGLRPDTCGHVLRRCSVLYISGLLTAAKSMAQSDSRRSQ